MTVSQLKKIFANKLVSNAGWLIFGRVGQAIIGMIVSLMTARYLGPSNYGLISYATAYINFFNSICTLGIPSLLVKEFVDCPQREGIIIGTALAMRFASSCMSAIVIVLISMVADYGEPLTICIVAICSISIIFNIFDTYVYWFQYKLESKTTAIISVVAYIAVATYRIIMLALQKTVLYFAFATSLDYLCTAVLLTLAYRKRGGSRLHVSISYGKSLFSRSYHFILSGIMVAVYGQTDKFMLKHMLGSVDTGYYSTAVYISNMWCFILSAIIASFYPIIMEANNRSEEEFIRKNKQLYAIVFYLCIFVSAVISLFSNHIINILYGLTYAPSVAPLRIVTWYTAFSYLGVARDAWIVCKNKQRYLKWIYVSTALVNVILNYVLIPRWGATGAAVASLVAQVCTIFVFPMLNRAMRENTLMIIEAVKLQGIKGKSKKGA